MSVGVPDRATTWNIMVIMPVLGVAWVFGVMSVNEQLVAFQYVFAVANSLQASCRQFSVSHLIYLEQPATTQPSACLEGCDGLTRSETAHCTGPCGSRPTNSNHSLGSLTWH